MSRIFKYSLALLTLLMANLASASPSSHPSTTLQLNKVDPRTMTDVTVAATYKIGGYTHSDFEYIGTWTNSTGLMIQQTSGTQDQWGIYRGNFLTTVSPGVACTTDCKIYISKVDTRTITDLVLEISFRIGGDMHYDSESVTIPGPPVFGMGEDFVEVLNVDGRNATWTGSQYEGNLLSTPTQITSFYWSLPNHEIWLAGFNPGASATVYYDNASFGPEALYSVYIDGNGVGHYTQNDVCYHLVPPLKMKYAEIYNPQFIRVVDNGSTSRYANATVNSIRVCGYAQ